MSDYFDKIKSFGLAEQRAIDESFSSSLRYDNLKWGMGVTIGNALRRVLLSHVPGYAIRSLNISGIQHEFSSIPGVKEDAQQLIMNLRKVVFKGEIAKTRVILNVNRAGAVFASDLSCTNLQVVNPELCICSVSEGFNLKLEMTVEKGVGIVLASATKDHEFEIGAIVCDAFFSPVESVNFEVEQGEGVESLVLDIKTNGSIAPIEAFKYSLNLLNEQLMKQELVADDVKGYSRTTRKIDVLNPNLFLKIDDLPEIPVRAVKCLKMLGIVFVGDLVKLSKETLMKEPNFGENSLSRLSEKLSTMGLSLGMDMPGWPPEDLESKSEDIRNSFVA